MNEVFEARKFALSLVYDKSDTIDINTIIENAKLIEKYILGFPATLLYTPPKLSDPISDEAYKALEEFSEELENIELPVHYDHTVEKNDLRVFVDTQII